MGLFETLGTICWAVILFQAMCEISDSYVIESGAQNVALCQKDGKKLVLCDSDVNCTNAIVPPKDYRGFPAPNGMACEVGCTCYRFGNFLSYCAQVSPEPEDDYKYY